VRREFSFDVPFCPRKMTMCASMESIIEASNASANARSGAEIPFRYGKALSTKERELIEIPALEDDVIVTNAEESTSAQAVGIAPFEDGPFAVFEEIFHDARHRCATELDLEHASDFGAAVQGFHDHLMIDGVHCVERCEAFDVCGVEPLDPFADELLG